MAKNYKLTSARKTANAVGKRLAKRGMGRSWVLTTIGRSSGERREVVITPVEVDDERYLVACYGPVAWVHNVRANPKATLLHGGASTRIAAVEVHEMEAGKALAKYYAENKKYVDSFMDIPGDKTVYDFAAVAHRYPVFRIEEASGVG